MWHYTRYFVQTLVLALFLNVNYICASDEFEGEEEDIFRPISQNIKHMFRQALPRVTETGITALGTKWCGPGNTASNYNDLGSQRDTDMCCRDHDHCVEILEPATILHGLKNTDEFPILACACEQKFINCLQTVDSITSYTVGGLYYGARSKCLANGHPIVGCLEYKEDTLGKRCLRYYVDKRRSKIWQLYDMPFFFSINSGEKLQVLNNSPVFICIMLFHFLYYYSL